MNHDDERPLTVWDSIGAILCVAAVCIAAYIAWKEAHPPPSPPPSAKVQR